MRQTFRQARWGLALAPLILLLAWCSSGSGGSAGKPAESPGATLKSADTTVQSAMQSYLAAVSACAKDSSPVVCLEKNDLDLGNKMHKYANVLAVGHGFPASESDLTTTRDAAQTLANSLEILGDAQPTQANYDQVLNTFNVNSAITALQGDVAALGNSLGKTT